MSTVEAQKYFVIPLSVQQDGDLYLIGNAEMGDFYQFPEQGLKILDMLRSGSDAASIRSRLAAEYPEIFDVDEFVDQLSSIGFIYPEDQQEVSQQRLHALTTDSRRTFNVDPRIAKAVFSPPAMIGSLAIVLYAIAAAVSNPELRINFHAFYTETNRTILLLVILIASFVQVAMHESGHMLAAAKHGVKSRYGIGHRLWTIVAESDLTGILTLPRSQRYVPMLAGLLVDILCAALLTILLQILLRHHAGPFAVQAIQALVLDIVVSIPWQFNIFIKTDIYFVICNYFGHPDLDRDARTYLRNLAFRLSFGRFGRRTETNFRNLNVLRVFSAIWLFGRMLSILVLFGVFLPTMVRYLASSFNLLTGPPTSVWNACDTIVYVSITLTMLCVGMYLWISQKLSGRHSNGENQ